MTISWQNHYDAGLARESQPLFAPAGPTSDGFFINLVARSTSMMLMRLDNARFTRIFVMP